MQEKIRTQDNFKNNGGVQRKLPLDLPVPRGRQRSNRYRYKSYDRYGEDAQKTTSLLRSGIICVAIVLLIIVLKGVDTPFTRNVLEQVRGTVTTDFDFEETLGKLKFVDKYMPDVKAVFGQQPSQQSSLSDTPEIGQKTGVTFSVPAEGKVIGYFGKEGSQSGKKNTGIDIQGRDNDNLYAVADGKVAAVGENEVYGRYIEIDQGNGIITLYFGCSELVVDVGNHVKKGQRIGKMGGNKDGELIIHFETWMDGKPIDPLSLMELGK